MRSWWYRWAVLLVLVLPACESRIEPLGPTPPGEGIAIFIHASFVGSSQSLNADVPDLGKVEGPCTSGEEGAVPTWSDCMSSLRVEPGWTATLFRDRDFKGASVTVTANVANLTALPGPCAGSFNDCVSSVRVARQ